MGSYHMDNNIAEGRHTCITDKESLSQYREKLPGIVEDIINNSHDSDCFTHVDYEPIPSEGYVVDIINKITIGTSLAVNKTKTTLQAHT